MAVESTPAKHGRRWFIVAFAVLLGICVGVGAYTYDYAEGVSYLSDDPTACINCHVMQDQYDAWSRGSHASVATCNDCHAPHGSILDKYRVKAINGFNHSLAFTTGNFPDNMSMTAANHAVTEAACRHCHSAMTHAIDPIATPDDAMSCIRCHRSVGHGH
jgi:cytochrome c nitrite reductase small subunit